MANILSRLAMFFDIWAVLGYSVKHKKFNSYDSQDNDEHSMKGYLWAELPEVGDE